jgi:murein L,D-transpeptidase YafK
MPYLLLFLLMLQQNTFKETQLKNTRVKVAYEEKETLVKKFFSDKGLSYSGFSLFLRAFKKGEKLELWIKEKNKAEYTLLITYDFCSSSGTVGPKRKEGDLQIPEGAYYINHFNPQSNFHLSLGISYPNTSDKILSDKKKPGSAIYVHGNCVTIGCIPITDEKIKELYIIAVEARNNGQVKIPIHIFPSKLDELSLAKLAQENPTHSNFWRNLSVVYRDFENLNRLRTFGVNGDGQYYLK